MSVNHIFKLNNKPFKSTYPYPFKLSYCPVKSCCNEEYAKLNGYNIFSKINTFNSQVVINSGNLQVKNLSSFPTINPGYGNYASINGTPYFYNSKLNTWDNLTQNNNSFTLESTPGIFTSQAPPGTGFTTFTFNIPNTHGQVFEYTIHSKFPPETITIPTTTLPTSQTPIELQSPTATSAGSLYGVGSGFAILQPYTYNGVNNAAYTFNSFSNPGFELYIDENNITDYLRTFATTEKLNSYTYTTSLAYDYSRNGQNTLIIRGNTLIN